MCDWCKQEIERQGGDPLGVICPHKAGESLRATIAKRLRGVELSDAEAGLLDAFETLTRSRFIPANSILALPSNERN